MKRAALVLALCLGCPRVSHSAPDVVFSMPQAQVVRLGEDKFMEVYSSRTKDYSTQGQMRGYDFYTRCKQADNDRRAANLNSKRRHQIALVRDALEQLGNSCWSMTEIEAGGGTMWRLASSSAYASREDAMGKLVDALQNPRRSKSLRRKTRVTMNKMQNELTMFRRAEIESNGVQSKTEAQKSFRVSFKAAQAATSKLKTLLAQLPDGAAQVVAQRAFDEVHNSQDAN